VGPLPLFGLAFTRRGARLAEVLSIAHQPMHRRLRRRALHREGGGGGPVAGNGGEGPSEDLGPAASNGGSPVVSAPDWPPVQQAQQAQDERQQQQQRSGEVASAASKPRRRQQPGPAEQQEAERQAAAATPPAAPNSADVRAFLKGASGGGRLRLEAWQEASPGEKQLQEELMRQVTGGRGMSAQRALLRSPSVGAPSHGDACDAVMPAGRSAHPLLADLAPLCWLPPPLVHLLPLQEAPKRRRLDEYDREYDRGRTKKVRSKRAADGGDGDSDGPTAPGSEAFNAAWRQKQREGVQTELRGNRRRRSAEFQQRGGGGRGRGRGPGRGGGRHGGRRHSFGRGGGRGRR
jgi:hypothetical protein